ncbi:MAG: serine hydroxymethyltransferase [Patescibacteria group bacterium]|nr:serine hydroxymethyltransferase [Patescibacteria group bacterium]
MIFKNLRKSDSEIYKLIIAEEKRQKETINLIASENFVSESVLEALGSVFTNKYSEGYPDKRYYGGNENCDKLEKLCQKRALKLFELSPQKWNINVQPYSGSPANLAIYLALVPLGGKIMGMRLDMGGHLTHGHKASATGKLWKQIPYGVSLKTELLDYDEIMRIAKKEKPDLIVCGYTAYSRIIDFKKFRKIADAVNAYLMVDMSHFAGLVAGDVYPSPFKYADVIMTTTHKTLRGPRAALIFSKKELSEKINKSVFPGLQGGPHMNTVASIAVALAEAAKPEFKKYAQQVVQNSKTLASELQKFGWRIVSGGTDTHLFLVDTISRGISGKTTEKILEKNGIIVNKNTIPFDKRPPTDPSGIRIGTPAITSQGFKEKNMKKIAEKINFYLTKRKKYAKLK